MTNQDFISAWEESMSRTPCITLFEDIDGVFNGRENVATKGSMNSGLTFDCLLNTLDGVQNTDGCFIVVTTNCIEHVDRAIGIPSNGDDVSSRPGRIDRVINFVPLSTEGKEKMANRILGGFPENKWKHLITEAKDRTGAQFQDMCSRLALKLFWEGKKEHTT
jgi:ATP-dependent 26S proteasome regulatory subunit